VRYLVPGHPGQLEREQQQLLDADLAEVAGAILGH